MNRVGLGAEADPTLVAPPRGTREEDPRGSQCLAASPFLTLRKFSMRKLVRSRTVWAWRAYISQHGPWTPLEEDMV